MCHRAHGSKVQSTCTHAAGRPKACFNSLCTEMVADKSLNVGLPKPGSKMLKQLGMGLSKDGDGVARIRCKLSHPPPTACRNPCRAVSIPCGKKPSGRSPASQFQQIKRGLLDVVVRESPADSRSRIICRSGRSRSCTGCTPSGCSGHYTSPRSPCRSGTFPQTG